MRTRTLTVVMTALALMSAAAWAQAPGTAGIGPQGEKSLTREKAPRAGAHGQPGRGMRAGEKVPGVCDGSGPHGPGAGMGMGGGPGHGCRGACAMHGPGGGRGMGMGRGPGHGRCGACAVHGPGGGKGMGRGPGAGPRGPGVGMGREPGMGRGRGMGPGALMRELDLTEAQREKAADLHERALQKTVQLRADLASGRIELRRLMRTGSPDARAVDAQIDRLSALRGSIQKARVATMLELRGMLTPEQRKRFDAMHREGPMGPGMRRGMGPWGFDEGPDVEDEGEEG
jgi:Spy/CpxP family protein refolding chaperone